MNEFEHGYIPCSQAGCFGDQRTSSRPAASQLADTFRNQVHKDVRVSDLFKCLFANVAIQIRPQINFLKELAKLPAEKINAIEKLANFRKPFRTNPNPALIEGIGFSKTLRMSVRNPRASQPRSKPQELASYLNTQTDAVNRALHAFLPASRRKPATVHRSMRYSVFAGGKRLRPVLCLAAADACGGEQDSAMPLACAVECVHTYSLVHDDLPAMDNDDFRRGKPTNHKVFGEGIAILTGDALLTQAFEIAAQCKGWPRYSHQAIIRELSLAAGSLQLIAGQVADLEGEGKTVSAAQLQYIHERKTSALLCCSVRLGGMSANCTPASLKALTDFGYNVGLAFQVIDDILDVTRTSEQLGKTAGKDTAAHKATYPSIVGLERSRRIAQRLTQKAYASLDRFGKKGARLRSLAGYLLERNH